MRYLSERGFFIDREKYPEHDNHWCISLRWLYVIIWKDSFGYKPSRGTTAVRWHRFDVEWTKHPTDIWRKLL